MKVLFLDIDGVLNRYGENATKERFKGVLGIDMELLGLFKQIHPVNIVLSSTWRLYKDHFREVRRHINIFDKTPVTHSKRHTEIRMWLDKHDVEDFVILDDDWDANIEGHFFYVPNGLTMEIVDKVNHRLINGRS